MQRKSQVFKKNRLDKHKNKSPRLTRRLLINGGAYESRTRDLFNAIEARYQLR